MFVELMPLLAGRTVLITVAKVDHKTLRLNVIPALGKQQQMADEIIEASAAQLGKQLEENLDLFGEQLKLKQEQAASGVAEAFRSKMVEMLSVFQSPPRSSPPPAQPPSPDAPSL